MKKCIIEHIKSFYNLIYKIVGIYNMDDLRPLKTPW